MTETTQHSSFHEMKRGSCEPWGRRALQHGSPGEVKVGMNTAETRQSNYHHRWSEDWGNGGVTKPKNKMSSLWRVRVLEM